VYRGNYSDFEATRAPSWHKISLVRAPQREVKNTSSPSSTFSRPKPASTSGAKVASKLGTHQRIAPAHVDTEFTFSFLEPANCRAHYWRLKISRWGMASKSPSAK